MGRELSGRWSWYGGPHDHADNNRPALAGATNKQPGIAVYDHGTLGGYWVVADRSKRGARFLFQQTDVGPLPPRVVDINATAVRVLGYTEANFRTDGRTHAIYLGKNRVAAVRRARELGATIALPGRHEAPSRAVGRKAPVRSRGVTPPASAPAGSAPALSAAFAQPGGTGLADLLAANMAAEKQQQAPAVASIGIQDPFFSTRRKLAGMLA